MKPLKYGTNGVVKGNSDFSHYYFKEQYAKIIV